MKADLFAFLGRKEPPKSNESRPSDPISLKPILKKTSYGGINYYDAMAQGTSHVVHNYFAIDDFINDDGFQTACDEILKAIRMYYKTILPYDVQLIKQYVRAVTCLYALARNVEFILSMYNVVEPRIPGFHDALTHVSGNFTENGVVDPIAIKFLQGQDFDDTLRDFDFVCQKLSGLMIPKNVKILLDDWFGIAMRDQSDPSGQLYVNLLRDVTLYGISANGWYAKGKFGIENITMNDILVNIKELLSVTAMINADVASIALKKKKEVLVPAKLPQFKVGSISDKREDVVNYLINKYIGNINDYHIANLVDTEYTRADIYGKVTDDNQIMVSLAWAKAMGKDFLFDLKSQAVFLNVDAEFVLPTELNTDGAGQITAGWIAPQSFTFYQLASSFFVVDDVFKRNAANATVPYTATLDSRISDAAVLTGATSISFKTKEVYLPYVNMLIPQGATGTKLVLIATQSNGSSLYFKLTYTSGSVTTLQLVSAYGGTETVLANIGTASTDPIHYGTVISSYSGDTTVGIMANANATFNCSSTTNDKILLDYFRNNASWYVSQYFGVALYSLTSSSVTYAAKSFNMLGISYFIECVDFHIPVWTKKTTLVYDGASLSINVAAPAQLLKECYTPIFYPKDTIRNSMRYAMLGLFASGGYTYVVDQSMDRQDHKGAK